jgi:hypothetical protein
MTRLSRLVGAACAHIGAALMLGIVPACSSGASSSSYMQCQNPTASEQACFACINASCSSQVQAYEAACSSYLACQSACDCGDLACSTKCSGGVQGTEPCGNAAAVQSFFACEATCQACMSTSR